VSPSQSPSAAARSSERQKARSWASVPGLEALISPGPGPLLGNGWRLSRAPGDPSDTQALCRRQEHSGKRGEQARSQGEA